MAWNRRIACPFNPLGFVKFIIFSGFILVLWIAFWMKLSRSVLSLVWLQKSIWTSVWEFKTRFMCDHRKVSFNLLLSLWELQVTRFYLNNIQWNPVNMVTTGHEKLALSNSRGGYIKGEGSNFMTGLSWVKSWQNYITTAPLQMQIQIKKYDIIQYQPWEGEHNWFEWPYLQGKITGWDFRMWWLAILIGWPHWKFARTKKTCLIITRWLY